MLDTDNKAYNLYLEKIASLTPEERFIRMNNLCAFGKLASLEGLKEKNPNLSKIDLVCLFAKNLHGENFSIYIRNKLLNE